MTIALLTLNMTWNEQKIFWCKIKSRQLVNQWIPLINKFMNYIINSFQNNWAVCKSLEVLYARKHRLFKRWILSINMLNTTDAENMRQMYNKARNKIEAVIRKLKWQFDRSIGAQSKTSPKIFRSHILSKLKIENWCGTPLTGQNLWNIYNI